MQEPIMVWALGILVLAAPSVHGQTIPEIARSRPSSPVVRGVFRDISPVPLDQLSREAPVILIGRLTFAKSYLTPNEMDILSDYAIEPEQVLAGQFPASLRTPGRSGPTLTIYGGDLTFDGVTVSAVDYNVEPPQSGGRFLMFLQPYSGEPGRYQLVHAAIFEVQNDRLRSIIRAGDTPKPYAEVTAEPLPAAASNIARLRRR